MNSKRDQFARLRIRITVDCRWSGPLAARLPVRQRFASGKAVGCPKLRAFAAWRWCWPVRGKGCRSGEATSIRPTVSRSAPIAGRRAMPWASDGNRSVPQGRADNPRGNVRQGVDDVRAGLKPIHAARHELLTTSSTGNLRQAFSRSGHAEMA